MSPSEWIALVSILATILAGFGSLFWQTRAKRRDDKHAAQLDRLNRQLSQLYGPLYALYEEGERNWMLFVARFSRDSRPWATRTFLPSSSDDFPPPGKESMVEYRRRMEKLFMPTNTRMERLIVEHADLIVGTRMPDEFSDFLAHVASAKLLMHQWKSDSVFGPDQWKRHHAEYPHPPALKHLIRGSFEVLKSTQQKLLTGSIEPVDEASLGREIEKQMKELDEQWKHNGPSYSRKLVEAQAELAVDREADASRRPDTGGRAGDASPAG
jgi:hypothetical protein